MKQFLK